MAAGQTLVMLTGGVDLSVATTATAGRVHDLELRHRRDRGRSLLAALAVGLGIGLVNGIGVAIFRVNPLIMTLGVSTVTIGALTIYSQTRFLSPSARPRHEARLGPLPHLRPVRPARLGADRGPDHPRAPLQRLRPDDLRRRRQRHGVPARRRATWQVLLAVYALCGALSAAAGILLVGFNDAADLGIATPFLLPSVAAVVIGGTSIFGGVGGYAGTILGALILTVLDSLLTILNASQAVRQILYGLIILALAAIYARAASAD